MALDYRLSFKGEKQGDIKGSTLKTGAWADKHEGIALYMEGVAPRDFASGQSTGKRQYKPVCVKLHYNQGTPQLWQAFSTNEALSEVFIECFSPNSIGDKGGLGVEKVQYTVKLKDAFISRITHDMPNNRHSQETMRMEHTITVEMVFRQIEHTWVKNGISSSDDWTAPTV